MNAKQNPFSLYDFLGYFTPGALLIYGCLIIDEYLFCNTSLILNSDVYIFSDKIEIYLLFILSSYVLGHMISFISSITIEKYAVWIHGHPSKCLLNIESKGYFHIEEKDYKGYILARKPLRFLVLIILLPITFWDIILGKFLNFQDLYINPVDDFLRSSLSGKIIKLIENNSGSINISEHDFLKKYDFFRYVYHYTIENAGAHVPRMKNYLASYGFLRTASFLSIILFWCIFIFHIWPNGFKGLHVAYLIIYSLIPYILYMGFVKFFKRFCLEAMMAVAVTYEMENSNKSTD